MTDAISEEIRIKIMIKIRTATKSDLEPGWAI